MISCALHYYGSGPYPYGCRPTDTVNHRNSLAVSKPETYLTEFFYQVFLGSDPVLYGRIRGPDNQERRKEETRLLY